MKKRILQMIGTRPEAIKMSPVALELAERPGLSSRVCFTGQHRELLEQAAAAFGLRPDCRLEVMEEEQSLDGLTARLLTQITQLLREERPDLLLVHGDTTTAFAAALAAFYLEIPVGHVEAGLRTGDLAAPFPEEFNRVAVDRLSKWHFAPTPRAAANLLRERCPPESIQVTGNTVVDAMKLTLREDFSHPVLAWAGERPLVLMTIHRREGLDALAELFASLRTLIQAHGEAAFCFPVHPNPRVRRLACGLLGGLDNLMLSNPLEVRAFHNLLARCALVLTDSGGIQEEAAVLGKQVLVLRDATERPEGIAGGLLHLVGREQGALEKNFAALLENAPSCDKIHLDLGLYGDGRAARRIADTLERGTAGADWRPAGSGTEGAQRMIIFSKIGAQDTETERDGKTDG